MWSPAYFLSAFCLLSISVMRQAAVSFTQVRTAATAPLHREAVSYNKAFPLTMSWFRHRDEHITNTVLVSN